jgi:hypothetical protein
MNMESRHVMTDQKQNREGEAPAEPRRHLREPLEVIYEDGRRETIIVRRLTNTDMMKWIDLSFDKQFLVFRSGERSVTDGSATVPVANQLWFDSLTQDSAFAIVETALELNHSPRQKKVMAAVMTSLQSWLSVMPSTSSTPAATTPTS